MGLMDELIDGDTTVRSWCHHCDVTGAGTGQLGVAAARDWAEKHAASTRHNVAVELNEPVQDWFFTFGSGQFLRATSIATADDLGSRILAVLGRADCNCEPGDGTCGDWRDRLHRLAALAGAITRELRGDLPPEATGPHLMGRYVRIHGSRDEARARMVRMFGAIWSDQYATKEEAGVGHPVLGMRELVL